MTVRLKRLDGEDVAKGSFYSEGIKRPHRNTGHSKRQLFYASRTLRLSNIVAFGHCLLATGAAHTAAGNISAVPSKLQA